MLAYARTHARSEQIGVESRIDGARESDAVLCRLKVTVMAMVRWWLGDGEVRIYQNKADDEFIYQWRWCDGKVSEDVPMRG